MEDEPSPAEARTSAKTAPETPMIGVALGAGMARGFAHIGALRALTRHGIYPDIVAGTSIGSLVGGCYLAGKLDALEEWSRALNRRRIFSYLDFRVRSAGLIGGSRLAAILEEHFGDMNSEDLPYPFISIATDLTTGHEVWLRRGRLVDTMRASFALPGVFPPVSFNRRRLVDGALVNPVPVSACLALGARMTIAIDLNGDMIGKSTRPGEDYQTIVGFDLLGENAGDPADTLGRSSLAKRIFRRETNNPSLFGVMVSALNIIQDRLTRSRLAGDPPDIHVKPHVGHIGVLEFERAEELIMRGEEAIEQSLPSIRAAMDILLPKPGQPG